jgi:hypothetical protein
MVDWAEEEMRMLRTAWVPRMEIIEIQTTLEQVRFR